MSAKRITASFLAFGIGWMILEWQGRRLDRQRDERERLEKANAQDVNSN